MAGVTVTSLLLVPCVQCVPREQSISLARQFHQFVGYNQSTAWDLIFMTVKKRQKKFATKVAKKDKKYFKPFSDTQKKYKKGVLKHSVTKKILLLEWQKKRKNI